MTPLGAALALALLLRLLPEPLRTHPPRGWVRRLLGVSRQRAHQLLRGECSMPTLEAAIAARPVVDWPELLPAPEAPPRDYRRGGRGHRRACPAGLDLARPLLELRAETGAALATISRWRREVGIAVRVGRPNLGRSKAVREE